MRGEFLAVWSETWREIWLPLIERPSGEMDEGIPEDIFCELYREFAKALKKPTESAAIALLLADAIALQQIFERAAQRADHTLALERVKGAFERSGAEAAATVEERVVLLEAALSGLLGQHGAPALDAELQAHARDAIMVELAWERAAEKTINDPQASRASFEKSTTGDFTGERALVGFLESANGVLEDFDPSGGDSLTNHYFNLLGAFIEKYSLRYDVRRPCTLCPTLAGVFASLVGDLRAVAGADPHLDTLMKEFENAVRDLRQDCSDGRIKTCIQKQVNFLEAIGRTYPGVTGTTLGAISDQVGTWPHEKLKAAMKDLYGFTSDYPGIRHGGTPANAIRAVDMRDMVAMSILLAGFTPYLSDGFNPELVYRRA